MTAERMPINLERINDATGGDEEFLKELVEIFLDDAELRVQELASAISSGDLDEFGRTAHKLKGASANMGADGLFEMAKEMEHMDQSALGAAGAMIGELKVELARVTESLHKLVAG